MILADGNKEYSESFVLSQESTHKIRDQELHTTWEANLHKQVVESPCFWFSSTSIRPTGRAQGEFVVSGVEKERNRTQKGKYMLFVNVFVR